jgi:hypothetical protein
MAKVIEKTPFIFEDGNIYYFDVTERRLFSAPSSSYHNLWVYEKVSVKFLWKKFERYKLINYKPELINTEINTHEIKSEIKKILISKKVKTQLKDWDGFVGDIPEEMKKSFKREAKLNNILK